MYYVVVQVSLVLQLRVQPYNMRLDNHAEVASLSLLLLDYFCSLIVQLSATVTLPDAFLMCLVLANGLVMAVLAFLKARDVWLSKFGFKTPDDQIQPDEAAAFVFPSNPCKTISFPKTDYADAFVCA